MDTQVEGGEESQLSHIPEEFSNTERLQLPRAEMDRDLQPSILSGMGRAQSCTLREVFANPGPQREESETRCLWAAVESPPSLLLLWVGAGDSSFSGGQRLRNLTSSCIYPLPAGGRGSPPSMLVFAGLPTL